MGTVEANRHHQAIMKIVRDTAWHIQGAGQHTRTSLKEVLDHEPGKGDWSSGAGWSEVK